jgi:branched-chain amino acid transport system substrate-binding protein
MKHRLFMILAAVLLVLTVALSGCGKKDTAAAGDAKTASSDGGNVVKIATQSPLSGDYAAMGDSIKMGAELAVSEQKDKFKKMGLDIQLFPQDDQGDPKIGVSNTEMLVSDPNVLAVVGHLNSGVMAASGPKYENGQLPVVSPANTAIDLTEQGWKTFHRICARDSVQGPAGAEYAATDLKVKTVFVIHDKTKYGQGLADAFKAAAEKKGIQVVGYEGIDAKEKEFGPISIEVTAKKPDAVYFGGMYSQTGLLIKKLAEKSYGGYILSGDGTDNPELLKIAGVENVKKTIITSVAGDATKTELGKKFAADYKKKFNIDAATYSSYGYDAAQVVLAALEKATKDNGGKKPTREQLNKAISETKDLKGVFTTVTFDSKGDNEKADVFLYSFADGTYPGKYVKTISASAVK